MENDMAIVLSPDARSYDATVTLPQNESEGQLTLAVDEAWTVLLFIDGSELTLQVFAQDEYPATGIEPMGTLYVPDPKTKKD